MKYIIELVADSKGLDPAITAMNELRDAEKQLKTETSSVSAEQKKMMDAYAEKAKLGKASIDKMMDGYKQLGKAATGAFGGEAIKGATKAAESFRTQLKNSREELTRLFVDGKATTSQIYAAAKGAGNLKDNIGDAQQAISVLASDTFKLDAALQGVQVGAAGFQIIQGFAALAGGESEELQKTLVKLNAVMAITQGLQQIRNALQKQTALSMGLNIAAQKAYALVVGESTGGLRAFRLALAATGLGIFVIVLGEIVKNWDSLSKSIFGATKKTEDYADAQERLKQIEEDRQKLQDAELKYLKAKGASEKEILSTQLANAQGELSTLEKKIQLERNLAGFYNNNPFNPNRIKERTEAQKRASEIDKKYAADLLTAKANVLELENALKKLDQTKKDENKTTRDGDEALMQSIKNRRALEAEIARLEIEERKKKNEERIKQLREQVVREEDIYKESLKRRRELEAESEKAKREEELERSKTRFEARRAEIAAEIKAEEEKQTAIADASLQIAQETANAIFQIANANRNAEFNLQIQRLNELKTKELANKELTDAQRTRIEERYQRKIAAIKTKQAQADKQAAIVQALINGALAITKIFTAATPLNPASYAAIAITAATTAAQIAIISAQKIPKFAKGTEYVNGGGTETSDSVPAMLSRGERVIDAKTNKLLKGIPNALIPDLLIPKATMIEKGMDYDKMAKAFSKELAANPKLMVNFNKSGFETFIISGNTTTNVKNNRNDF